MISVQLPDLSRYQWHRTVTDTDVDGTVVPGLCAEFYRHDQAGRTASAGYYRYHGRTLLLAWGYVGEPHCRYTWVHDPDGQWRPGGPGCPQLRVQRDGERITGLRAQDAHGRWVELPAPAG